MYGDVPYNIVFGWHEPQLMELGWGYVKISSVGFTAGIAPEF